LRCSPLCSVIAAAVTREEYQTRKQRLAEQLRTGIELLQAAHRRQMAALEVLWIGTGEKPAAAVTVPPAPPPRQKTGELYGHVVGALAKVPDVFTRDDLLACLGYQPNRASLYRILQDLIAGFRAGQPSRTARRPLSVSTGLVHWG
jgi:hypothetical protein